MKQKLHRRRQRIFKRRNPLPTVVIVALGFFGAKYFTEHPVSPGKEPTSSAPVSPPTDGSSDSASSDTTHDTDTEALRALKAF